MWDYTFDSICSFFPLKRETTNVFNYTFESENENNVRSIAPRAYAGKNPEPRRERDRSFVGWRGPGGLRGENWGGGEWEWVLKKSRREDLGPGNFKEYRVSWKLIILCSVIFKHCDWMRCVFMLFDWFVGKTIEVSR
jgi:hypothetical protein